MYHSRFFYRIKNNNASQHIFLLGRKMHRTMLCERQILSSGFDHNPQTQFACLNFFFEFNRNSYIKAEKDLQKWILQQKFERQVRETIANETVTPVEVKHLVKQNIK